MFNSPLGYCPRCCQYVALDLTQRECAAEHQCGKELCPLENHFMGMKAGSELTAPERPGGDEVPGLSPPADALGSCDDCEPREELVGTVIAPRG